MRPTFRPIDPDADRPTYLAFARDLMDGSFGSDFFEREFGPNGAKYVSWLAERIADAPGYAAFVELDGKPVGCIVLGRWDRDASSGYVYHYYLLPGARRRGLGAALDDHAIGRLREQGFTSARLSVVETNTPALRFYAKRGWVHAGPREGRPGTVYLQRNLAGTPGPEIGNA